MEEKHPRPLFTTHFCNLSMSIEDTFLEEIYNNNKEISNFNVVHMDPVELIKHHKSVYIIYFSLNNYIFKNSTEKNNCLIIPTDKTYPDW